MSHADDALARLESLSQGFRHAYLDNAQLDAQLRAWAEAFPALVSLRTIGQSLEGRPLVVAVIGPEPERVRPSVWVDANMHATELCGSSVALAIAEDALRNHLAPEAALHELPAHVRARLREVLFFVLPRMCPDGAAAVLRDGRYVRSNPRDRRVAHPKPRWITGDVDGDGLSLLMRRRDPTGEYVASREVPGMLVARTLEDEGPFYKVYPEGTIEPWDGRTVPDPYFLSDNDTDLNRNFPWSWSPEPEQAGAGSYPASEPESRAVVEFANQHPEIFAWLDLHTFGGVYIRPYGHLPDKKMDPGDLALFRQIAAWGETYGGYPTVSGHDEFLYEPDKPLHGDLADFAFHQRGAIAFVCELWDLFARIGIARKKPFVDHYAHVTRDEMERLGRWDRELNASRVLRPWRACTHPQLGEVEVGGVDPRVGLSNPPYELVGEVCAKQSAVFLRVAALAPSVVITAATVQALGEGGELYRVSVTVENRGYLPTHIVAEAKSLPWNEPLAVTARGEGGCALVSEADARREVGHLAGWGRGLFDGGGALYHQRSRGSAATRTLEWVVAGRGVLALRLGGCRTGWIERRVEVG